MSHGASEGRSVRTSTPKPGRGSWLRRLFGRRRAPLDPDSPDLLVVATSDDDAAACSAVLAAAPAFRGDREAVLRHRLLLRDVAEGLRIVAQDGYAAAGEPSAPDPSGLRAVAVQRVQVVDALHCSQERSRMAGLAQRDGGRVLGWDVLQPPES